MTSGNDENQNVSVNVPVGVIATGLVLGLASAIYMLIGRNDENVKEGMAGTASQVTRGARGTLRKAALTALIAAIENDATRRLVVAVLKAMAKRS